jgi:hypothetical protein
MHFLAILALLLAFPAAAQNYTGNSLGIVSTDNRIFPGTVQLGGVPTAGDVLTTTVTVQGVSYPLPVTVAYGDTLQSVIDEVDAAINASTAMQGFGITGLQGNPSLMQYSVTPVRNSYGVPIIAVSVSVGATLTASIVRQPANTMDAAPIFYIDRSNPDAPPVAGDVMGPIIFGNGNETTGNCCSTAYGMIQGIIMDPSATAPKGAMAFDTACALAAYGNVCNRLLVGQGLQVFDAASAPPVGGDMGAGTINLPSSGGIYRDGVLLVSRQSMGGYSGTALPAATVSYVGLTTQSPDLFANLIGVGVSGTIKNFSLSLNSAPGAGQSYTVALLVNGAVSGVGCTISAAASSCSDMLHAVALLAPASLAIRVTTSAAANVAKAIWSLEYGTQ